MSHRPAVSSAAIALIASIAISAAAIDRVQGQSVVYKPGNGVTLPVVVKEVKPQYTPQAMKARIQGTVWLECVVNESGDVSDVTVTRSLDKEYGLDEAAIAAARQWKFKPGQKDGKPVAVRITLELTFTLKQ